MTHSQSYLTTLSANLDLFFVIGASRGNDLFQMFDAAYDENRTLALRMLAWARDVRGGAGERGTVRKLLQHLEFTRPHELELFIPLIPEYGRWDDLLIFTLPKAKALAFEEIRKGLVAKNGLCAKWMPRKGQIAVELRNYLAMTPKQYRKTLVGLTEVVETKMCAKEWTDIEFTKVPSVASSRYQKAFIRNGGQAYQDFIKKVESGEAKINASAIFPHDVYRASEANTDKRPSNLQWEALPNFIPEGVNILPMLDVSGSMFTSVPGNTGGLMVAEVANALALYTSSKNTGSMKDMIMSFTDKPKLQRIEGETLSERIKNLDDMDVGYSTNVEAAVSRLLVHATELRVPQEDMPDYLLIISDMAFNMIGSRYSDTAYKSFIKMYEEAGYKMPNVVFWNVNAKVGNIPVQMDTNGVALISGFSPAILERVLSAKSLDPISIMVDTLNAPRYEAVK